MNTKYRYTAAVLSVLLLSLPVACSKIEVNELPGNPIYLTDMTGKKWDFTYAIVALDFDRLKFSASAGPYARPPMTEFEFAKPGDRTYPPPFATVRIVGTSVGGDARAYPLASISRNEVVDDMFGEVPVAVAY